MVDIICLLLKVTLIGLFIHIGCIDSHDQTLQIKHTMCPGSSSNSKLVYSAKELLGFRKKLLLYKDTTDIIAGLSIRKPFRGKRSGNRLAYRIVDHTAEKSNRSTAKPGNETLPILVRITNQKLPKPNDTQNRIKYTNLIKVNILEESNENRNLSKFTLFNARSVRNKCDEIVDYVVNENMQILAITETWLTKEDEQICNELTPDGYTLIHKERQEKRGGGVAVLCRKALNPNRINAHLDKFKSFEIVTVSLIITCVVAVCGKSHKT